MRGEDEIGDAGARSYRHCATREGSEEQQTIEVVVETRK
jgi:hypothetical protein